MNIGVGTEAEIATKVYFLVRSQQWTEIAEYLDEHSFLTFRELEVNNYTYAGESKKFLLSLALRYNPPLDFVQRLMHENPLVLSTSAGGPLPLHSAVTHCAEGNLCAEIVKLIAGEFESALAVRYSSVKYNEGDLPLHLALSSGSACQCDLVTYLAAAYPGAVIEKSSGGCGVYPVEMALLKGYPLEVISKLMVSDHTQGSLAMGFLLAALKGQCSEEVLRIVIDNAEASAHAAASISSYEKQRMFNSCVAEALKSCTSSAMVMMLFRSQLCVEVTASIDGARCLMDAVYEFGHRLVANCTDGAANLQFIAESLLNGFPDLAQPYNGKLALQDAVERHAHEVVLLAIIKANPSAALTSFSYPVSAVRNGAPMINKREIRVNGLALHFALHKGCSLAIVSTLVELNPQSVLERESSADGVPGSSVMQLAMEGKAHDVVGFLFQRARGALPADAWGGCFALALAQFRPVWRSLSEPLSAGEIEDAKTATSVYTEIAEHILTIRPGEAVAGKGVGAQPIHSAIACAPARVIEKLLRLNPRAAAVQLSYTTRSSTGKTVYTHADGLMLLHLAVSRADVIRTVIAAYPDAVKVRGAESTPIQLAIANKSPLECVKLLTHQGEFQCLCSAAVSADASPDVYEYLFARYPTEVSEGLLLAALKHKRNEVLVDRIASILLAQPPSADGTGPSSRSGKTGCSVLLAALQGGYSVEMFRKLLQVIPGAAAEPMGSPATEYALMDAIRLGVPIEILKLLLDAFPAVTLAENKKVALWDQVVRDSDLSNLAKDAPNKVPSGKGELAANKDGVVAVCLAALEQNKTIFTAMMSLREMSVDAAVEIIHSVFRAHPDWTYLCRGAVEKTQDAIRAVMNQYLFFCGRYEQQLGAPLHCSATAVVVEFNDHAAAQEYAQSYDTFLAEGLIRAMATVHIEATHIHEESLANYLNTGSACTFSHEEVGTASPAPTISAEDYSAFCMGKFGRTRKVVIKFMRDETQFQREIATRVDGKLDEKFVVPLLQDLRSDRFVEEIKKERVRNVSIDFRFGLVMPAADRSVDAIFRSERPGITHVRLMMLEIGLALQHCHERGIVHGDLKMLNVLRVGDRIRLIDMDAAAAIDSDFLAAKFSSGVLPPELFAELAGDQVLDFHKYWSAEASAQDNELWRKVEPRQVTSRGIGVRRLQTFVVKTYRTTADGRPDQPQALPYALVKASAAADVWAFGSMLYTFLSGEPLLAVNRDDDLVGGEEFRQAATWTAQSIADRIATKIGSEECVLAVDLLTTLLDPDAGRRGAKSIAEHLQHPFFLDAIKTTAAAAASGSAKSSLEEWAVKLSADMAAQNQKLIDRLDEQKQLLVVIQSQTQRIEERTQYISQMSNIMILQIKRTEKVMLKAMFEASDVTVPSCFVILNREMKAEEAEAGDKSAMDKAISWTKKLARIAKTVADTVTGGETSFVNDAVRMLVEGEKLWLYLVDEYTMEPVLNHPHYPIPITKPREFVAKVLPLMKLGLKAASALNTAASVARCLGYPVPCVPSDMMALASNAVNGLGKKSSVEEFDCLQRILDCETFPPSGSVDANPKSSQAKSLRGAALREFARFLAQHDEKCLFSGLCRVATEEGMCCWTLPENVDKVSEGMVPQAMQMPVRPPPLPAAPAPAIAVPNPVPAPVPVPAQAEIPGATQSLSPKRSKESDAELVAYAKQVKKLQEELAQLKEANLTQMQTIALLAETIPKSLHAMRTDIVSSVSAAVATKKK